ncbi:hypothetical protein [Winogradskyella sp. PG-2]|uniref:hypothetical protein n=1 Tax=Winogradskyella sp. PG-2 TaxID=754409 RepID=UPI00045881CD|nr:hypothetical protein [Winogradskyella sp. PG-2]BAO76025.1 hypothetical protein WPG_1795 [Winogradskyella sp. PG-2]
MNRQKKTEILVHCAQIVAGLLIIIPFFNATSWTRFIALAGFLLVMYNLIWFVRNSEEILYEIFPTKHKREKNPSFKHKIWQHISVVLFMGGLFFLIFQMDNIENIIEEPKFWKSFALVGFVTGILSLFLIRLIRPSVFDESGRRYAIIFGFILGFMSISAASASYFNSKYATSNIVKSEFIVERKSFGGNRTTAYWIFIDIDNSTKRFELKKTCGIRYKRET